jgi:acetyl-CoA acetyltransferase
MIGLDRRRREVHLAPYLDDDGKVVTPPRDAKRGLATLCIGGGMGIVLTVER